MSDTPIAQYSSSSSEDYHSSTEDVEKEFRTVNTPAEGSVEDSAEELETAQTPVEESEPVDPPATENPVEDPAKKPETVNIQTMTSANLSSGFLFNKCANLCTSRTLWGILGISLFGIAVCFRKSFFGTN